MVAPLWRFVPARDGDLDGPWLGDVPYELEPDVLSFVPLGRHTLRLARTGEAGTTIVRHESGLLARVRNHTIRFREVAPGAESYTDEIEIRAGWLAPAV